MSKKVSRVINCSFCGKEILRDRYNFVVKLERQNFPPNGFWEDGTLVPRENLCQDCFQLSIDYFKHILDNLRRNKGIYKAEN